MKDGHYSVYVNGDSQTIGTDLNENGASYPYHLVKLMGGKIIENPAIGGACIDRILRTTHQYLDDCERNDRDLANCVHDPYPDFVIIGWTEYSRYDWFYNGKMRTAGAELDGLGPDETHQDENLARTAWQTFHLSSPTNATGQIAYYYNQMMNLHDRLKWLKIPHLFLNAHAGFYDYYGAEHRGNAIASELFEEFDWENCFWNVFSKTDCSFTSWAGRRNYKHVDGWHYEKKAHFDFGQYLYSYVQRHDLMNMYKEKQ